MRRLVALALLLPAAALAAIAAGGDAGERYRVDAIFDNASSLIPGQDVKIAGARVGTVRNIELARDLKARVQMEIDPRFGPFRADAACVIRPQSLVGEKFIQCSPGTPRARRLDARGGEAPTVPLARNSSPVDLDLVFTTLKLPYRERLTVLVNELGAGLAGRPDDLAAAIRRANPALKETNEVLAVLDRDRAVLRRLVERSDSVLRELAARRGEVTGFVDRAGQVTEATAGRRADLDQAVHRLPGLLAELEPTSERLAALAREGTPAARRLREAAPAVTTLLGDLEPLSDAARPALRRLSEMSKVGRRAARAARPVGTSLRQATALMPRPVRVATELVESLRERGVVEGLQSFVYFASAATSRFDRFSHIIPTYQIAGPCNDYAREPEPGCSARWGGTPAAISREARRRPREAGRAGGSRDGRSQPRRGGPAPRVPRRDGAPPPPPPPAVPAPAAPPPSQGDGGIPFLDWLLGP